VLVNGDTEKVGEYIDGNHYIQHDPMAVDGVEGLETTLKNCQYDKIHRVLAEGNFVLVVTEGSMEGVHTSFYDLFRVESEKIVEHWNTVEKVPPQSEWKNDNGKF